MKKSSEDVIQLVGVGKKYYIHHEKPTLAETVLKGKNETFWALDNINITVKRGERIGIVGHNGSGKTTLLKIINGITAPTTGTVYTKGKIISLIDLEAGFHPDLSGIQNIYLNGLLIGLQKNVILQKMNDIIAFADIGPFIDAPLYTYSSGMKLRLGFSIAAHADPDILILDEGLAVGDKNFQQKAHRRIQMFFKQRKTIIIVSHWLEFIQHNSDRVLLLQQGRIVAEGSTKKMLRLYKNSNSL